VTVSRQVTLAERASHHVQTWAPRLRINERVTVKIGPITGYDGSEDEVECALFAASAVPEFAGRWDFVVGVSDTFKGDDADLDHAVRHELVHLLLEPLRACFFRDAVPGPLSQDALVTEWETVIERIADAFWHAYQWPPSVADFVPAEDVINRWESNSRA
jgi:hypothetical protein